MNAEQYNAVDKLADDIYAKFDELHKKGLLSDIEAKMKEACSILKKEYSISCSFDLEVCSHEKERGITIMKRGLSCADDGQEPYMVSSGSTPHRYVVNGEIVKIPHDYCPNCWGEWDFKIEHRQCPSCGCELGKEVKLLLDTDICPHCEEGKVSRSNPKCTKCKTVLDSSIVNWG